MLDKYYPSERSESSVTRFSDFTMKLNHTVPFLILVNTNKRNLIEIAGQVLPKFQSSMLFVLQQSRAVSNANQLMNK